MTGDYNYQTAVTQQKS